MGWKWPAYYLLLAAGATPPFRPRAHDNGTLNIGDHPGDAKAWHCPHGADLSSSGERLNLCRAVWIEVTWTAGPDERTPE